MMDNPEEVLQALDDFQKIRPSEIPKVLEEYLTCVAKTGEPIYQWHLIKTLFREKLLRVINEFYESGGANIFGPPLPNVEPFNYKNMKSNLLDRLENFANPPFTVQRICELLIAPRREYNRIDKYMRAFEKNILVVSTKEPGSAFGRRSENGDSLVNGSVEDETSHHGQSSNDVDMENWVKDCTNVTPVAMHMGTNEDMAVDSELKSFEKHARIEQLTAIDATVSSFVTAAEFQVTTVLPPQIPINHDVSMVEQSLPAVTGLADVDAVTNEDTSSQPSLELETEDTDSNDSKKLQTTFQAKDFKLDENKLTVSELQDCKTEENTADSIEPTKENELVPIVYPDDKQVSDHCTAGFDILNAITTEPVEITQKIELLDDEKCKAATDECIDSFQLSNSNLHSSQNNIVENLDVPKVESIDSTEITIKENEKIDNQSPVIIIENVQESISSETTGPIIEEPPLESTEISSSINLDSNVNPNIISESLEKETKAVVLDQIPIVEEPQETKEIIESSNNDAVTVAEELIKTESVITNVIEESTDVPKQENDDKVVEKTSCEETITNNKVTMESMDIGDGTAVVVQQQEPMEQETSEAVNS